MKTILLLGILVFSTACNSTNESSQILYQSGNWICNDMYVVFGVPTLSDCTNILTLDKVNKIINATNVIEIQLEKN